MSKKQPNVWIEGLQTVGLSIFLALGMRQFVAEARYIPTGSMEPTLQINDRLMIEKISYRLNPPQQGDIVVFRPTEGLLQVAPDQHNAAFIKRVIGVPGDTVQVMNGQVLVNGIAIEEDYIKAAPDYQWGPNIVPEASYLVLGDNRNNSLDSHIWGYVPQDNIIGRAAIRIWPIDRMGGLN